MPSALLALALCGGALRAVLHWHLMSGGALAQQGPMVIEAGAAVVVAMTTHSPFGEAERATGRWLPYLRLGAALALTGIAIGALQLGVTGASLPGGVLVLARNVIGITGIGLLASLVTGGLLAWIPPLGYLGFAEYALNEAWRSPWTWPVRPPADRGAWICAAAGFRGRPGRRHIPRRPHQPRRQRLARRSSGKNAKFVRLAMPVSCTRRVNATSLRLILTTSP